MNIPTVSVFLPTGRTDERRFECPDACYALILATNAAAGNQSYDPRHKLCSIGISD